MYIEWFGIERNAKTEILCSRMLTELIVNMSIMVNKVSVYPRNMLR